MDKGLQKVVNAFRLSFLRQIGAKDPDKEGQIKPFVLNPAQQILDKAVQDQLKTEGKVRVIILKARQQGLSTYVGGYLYQASQRPAQKALVVSHLADSTRLVRSHTEIP